MEHSQYGNLRSEMVRDRIVVGLLDETLSMKLQLDSELTLEKAIAARQHESIRQQQEVDKHQQMLRLQYSLRCRPVKEKRVNQSSSFLQYRILTTSSNN